jgi:hypothetical protein
MPLLSLSKREPVICKWCLPRQKGLDTNFNSALASLKFTRPDNGLPSVSSSVFQHSDSGVEKCIENACSAKVVFPAKKLSIQI